MLIEADKVVSVPSPAFSWRGSRDHFSEDFIPVTKRHPERTREGSGPGVKSQILREYAQNDNCRLANSFQLARTSGCARRGEEWCAEAHPTLAGEVSRC